jgi:hypothetical protein
VNNNNNNIPSRNRLGAWTVLVWVKIGTGGEPFEDGNAPSFSIK